MRFERGIYRQLSNLSIVEEGQRCKRPRRFQPCRLKVFSFLLRTLLRHLPKIHTCSIPEDSLQNTVLKSLYHCNGLLVCFVTAPIGSVRGNLQWQDRCRVTSFLYVSLSAADFKHLFASLRPCGRIISLVERMRAQAASA